MFSNTAPCARMSIVAHAEQRDEDAVDPRIDVLREAVGQRRDEAGIALDDVRVVEDRQRRVGDRRRAQQAVVIGRACSRKSRSPSNAHSMSCGAPCASSTLRASVGQGGEIGRRQDAAVRRLDRRAAHAIDDIIVAVHLAADQPVAQSGDRRHDDAVAPPADRIGRERDAGRARLDQALDDDGRRAAGRIEPARGPIGAQRFGAARAPDLQRGLFDPARRELSSSERN